MVFFLLAFVNKFELFGTSCYYIGSFDFGKACFAPWIYYLLWLIAGALVVIGVFVQTESNTTGRTNGNLRAKE